MLLVACSASKVNSARTQLDDRDQNVPMNNMKAQQSGDQHPSLTMTPAGVKKIRAGLGTVPLFDRQLDKTKLQVESAMSAGIDVPVPKDMGGGYTHERHKANYKLMNHAGNLYQITGEEKYAQYVKDMLLEYTALYPTLPLHPTMKSYATGKLFWQCLNDANWLVGTSQAYDCIHSFLSQDERDLIERDLFIPMANFLSIENPRFFNRIHNHSTWANAAVGMIALAMDNDSLLNKALYGLDNDGIDPSALDNDGGSIKKSGVSKAGFLAQLDYSFSPDGYFAEGPYYQRYAIFPFLMFSHALHNNREELDIFNYRDGILEKATNSMLQLTNTQGHFFPINDSQKGMSYKAYEVVNAVDLIYYIDNSQSHLLDWAVAQDNVALNEAGYTISKALQDHISKDPVKKSVLYGDGISGKEGGVAVLRSNDLEILFKYSTQGMGHGHFDRLSYSLYDTGGEVIQDYGAVRWVNIDQKGGGRYLPENKTFGKQTISHNTVVLNGKSQYEAKVKKAEAHHPNLFHSDFDNEHIQYISATENNAYPDTELHRSLFLVSDESLEETIFLDLMRVRTKNASTIELPLWYMGHTLKNSLDCPKSSDALSPLGEHNGYQHIWKESECTITDDSFQFNWVRNDRFYTMHAASDSGDKLLVGRAGANDPNYNLRSDPVLVHKKIDVSKATFFNIIEPHGAYSRVTEIPINPYGAIQSVSLTYEDENYVVADFSTADHSWTLMLSTTNNAAEAKHSVAVNGKNYSWQGVYKLLKTKRVK